MKYSMRKQSRKYFTLEEVERILPTVEILLQELQALHNAIELLESVELEVNAEEHEVNLTRLNKTYHRLQFEFYSKREELEKTGARVKDLQQGLIDFWHQFEGREVFLCWKLGETKLEHWHEVETGFAGRKKIVELGG